jgi:16S rRNA (uracil1498-N3)-methyltransferase
MSDPRLCLAPGRLRKSDVPCSIELDPSAAHHVSRVLRLRPGADVVLFDGTGGEFDASLTLISKKRVDVIVHRYREVSRESGLHIYLALGLSRGERMDFAIQKSVELGVRHIAPLITERGVVKLDQKRAQSRLTHWHQVAQSACEQCGRTALPRIDPPTPISFFIEGLAANGKRLVLDPRAPDAAPVDVSQHAAAPGQSASLESVVLCVGPEGGFTDAEVGAFIDGGFHRLRLGPRVLRTETAAAAAVMYAQMRWGDLN